VISVAVDGSGNLFIADLTYDDEDNSTYSLRKVSANGIITTLPTTPIGGFASLAMDAAGDLFVPSGSAVWKISPDSTGTVVAGNGYYGPPSGDGGPATSAQLNGVTAVAVDAAGNLLIADNGGRNFHKVTPDGIIHPIGSLVSSGLPPTGDGGPAVNAQLQLAVQGLSIQSGLAADGAGNLYIAETAAHRVRKVSASGVITTVAGVGGPPCSGPTTCLPLGDGGPATSAALSYPTSVAVDDTGNVFIADSGNLRVRKVAPDGTITTFAGNGSSPRWPPVEGEGGRATDAPLSPVEVAVDGSGNLYISQRNQGDVRKVSPDGIITTALASSTQAPTFGAISAATVDRAGNLFVGGWLCDSDDNCDYAVKKISPSGDATLLADGRNLYSLQPGAVDGGPAINAALGVVTSLAVDSVGNLFLTDFLGERVRKIDLNGIITTIGGNGASGYSGDGGPATKATMNYPFGLATDSAGNVYVSDFNQAVRIMRPSGQ